MENFRVIVGGTFNLEENRKSVFRLQGCQRNKDIKNKSGKPLKRKTPVIKMEIDDTSQVVAKSYLHVKGQVLAQHNGGIPGAKNLEKPKDCPHISIDQKD